jgi:hypothetical protein
LSIHSPFMRPRSSSAPGSRTDHILVRVAHCPEHSDTAEQSPADV